MIFKKKGSDIREAIEKVITHEREQREKAVQRFEKEKEKSALHMKSQLELNIKRFERILRHTIAEESYEVTEQDLVDFGL